MADSLVISSQIELLGGGVRSLIPACAGAMFRLAPGYDLSSVQPTTDIVSSLVLDGERPFGRRASNRTITLPIAITAPSRLLLAGARETLMQMVDAQTWTLTWTRDPGPGGTPLPLLFDCFRALPTVVTYELQYENQLWSLLTISSQALPYGHSDLPVQIAVASPIIGGSAVAAAPPPVVLDSFTSVSGTQWSQSQACVIGPNSAYWNPGASPANDPTGTGIYPSYSKTFAAKNLTGQAALSVWAGCGSLYMWNWEQGSQVSVFSWTLTDSSGHTLTFGTTYQLQSSNARLSPKWQLVSTPIPAVTSSAVFNMAAVTGYSVQVTNHANWYGQQFVYANFYLDTVCAQPPSVTSAASIRGAIYQLYGVIGTSHAPMTMQFQQPAVPVVTTAVLTGSGSWIPPAGVSVAKVEALGGAGAGATQTVSGFGGGGGGAEYAQEPALTIPSGGAPIPYACGTGGIPQSVAPNVALFTAAGTVTWTCPPGVTALTVAAVGGGGGGAAQWGAGAGAEYAGEPALAVTAGTVYTIVVGDGGAPYVAGGPTTFGIAGSAPLVTAHGGGTTASYQNTTAAPGGSGSANSVHYSGGAGGTGPPGLSGYAPGGGSSGGSSSAGNPGTSIGGGAAVTGGGPGGAGFASPVTGPGGGGGCGSGNPAYPPMAGAAGQVSLSWTVSSVTTVNGTATTFGSSATTGTVVTANGGLSAASNSATAGLGNTSTSSDTIHHSGGAGAAGASAGGGGGASGGSSAAGNAGSGSSGGVAVAGGTAGGAGATAANTGGVAGSPGAGGGGAWSTGTAVAGGAGGAGQITLTYTPALVPYRTLIAHRPGPDAPPTLTPFVSTRSVSDPPDGREYPVPSLIAGVNALFGGTYSVVLVNYNWDSPAAPREVMVTVHQYAYPGGASFEASVSQVITPAGVVNGFVVLGELTLPVQDIAPDNTTAYFTVGITSADLADQFLDVIFLDTLGSTIMIANNTEFYLNFFADSPTTDRDQGRVMGSVYDRAEAVSVLGSTFVSGGPLTVDPPSCILLAYAIEGPPSVAITYVPNWYLDRLC